MLLNFQVFCGIAPIRAIVWKRASERRFIAARVEAVYESQSGVPVVAGAMFEDISAGGGCIRLKTPLGVGTTVEIRWLHKQFQTKVMHCRPDRSDFLVGLQKAEDQEPWPTETRRQRK
jgi:hypothetical protein